MSYIHAFNPGQNATVNAAASSTVGSVQFGKLVQTTILEPHVRVANAGSGTAFFETGSSTVQASTTTSPPILAGSVEVVSVNGPWASVVTAAGVTTTVYFTPGNGV